MIRNILATLVIAAILWWIWKMVETYVHDIKKSIKQKAQHEKRNTLEKCPVCGMPGKLAMQVKKGKRHCPHVALGKCPYDPRKGVYRLRR